MDSSPRDVTLMIAAWAAGDLSARDRLLPLMYDQLRRLAGGYIRNERSGHTLQPTALVHEAYLRFEKQGPVPVECRGQFMAMMARTMRRVLVDYARERHAQKRGGDVTHVSLSEALDGSAAPQADILALHEVLGRLGELDERQAQIVEARVFGGFEVSEVAEMLGISNATVKRDWLTAKAWLHRELKRGQGSSDRRV